MSRLEIEWPDAGDERVRAAQGRLVAAGTALRAMSFENRLARVADVLASWTAPDSPWRRELANALAEDANFAPATIREGLDAALRAWRPEDFVACARREIGASLGDRTLAPFEWTLVIAGGAIPMPTILTPLVPLVLGSPVLLRGTRHDAATPELLARSLAERDPDLGSALEPIRFPVEDAAAYDAALDAPCVIATGGDEALAAIRARLDGSRHFVGYGHRFSIGVVGPGIADPATRDAAARGFAIDTARWDQTGCLSPVVLYLLGVDHAVATQFTDAIAAELDRLSGVLPCGELAPDRAVAIANERSSVRMRAGDDGARMISGDGYTVVLEREATPRPAPLGRFLRLMPVESEEALERVLRPFHGHLSSVALEGFAPTTTPIDIRSAQSASPNTDFAPIGGILGRAGVSRYTRAGRMQTPPVDWPHDGWPLFTPVARFTSRDSADAL